MRVAVTPIPSEQGQHWKDEKGTAGMTAEAENVANLAARTSRAGA